MAKAPEAGGMAASAGHAHATHLGYSKVPVSVIDALGCPCI